MDYTAHVAPFEPAFVARLTALAERVFGSVDSAQIAWKLERLPDAVVHLAAAGDWAGFKLGHADTPARFQSWLGGVVAEQRRSGIAWGLMQRQHHWARERGYAAVETACLPDNAAMLALNLRAGFRIIGTYTRDHGQRVLLRKRLRE